MTQLATPRELEPFERILIQRQNAVDDLLMVCRDAIRDVKGLPELVEAMELGRKSLRWEPRGDYEKRLEYARRCAEIAEKETKSGFAQLHAMATVLLWGALETAVKDFSAARLRERPELRQGEAFSKVKVRIGDYEALSEEERMEFLVEQLERDLGAGMKTGVGRFDCILESIGLSVPIDAETRKALHELSAVRNVLVHRAGQADKRFVASCPWFGVPEGQMVSVTHDIYNSYRQAVGTYAAAIIRSASGGHNDSAAAGDDSSVPPESQGHDA